MKVTVTIARDGAETVYECQQVRGYQITSPSSAIAAFVRHDPTILECQQEKFLLASLDVRKRVKKIHVLSAGAMNETLIDMRILFRQALADGAASIIVAHNHPSGDPSPSPEDVALTRRISEAGDLLGITMLDHLILSSGGSESMMKIMGGF